MREQVLAAEALVRIADDAEALIQTLYLSLMVHELLHDLTPVERLCRDGLAIGETIDHPYRSGPWLNSLGLLAYMQGHSEEGDRLFDECRRVTESQGEYFHAW